MTDQRDELIEFMIENIVFIIEMNTDTSRFILDDVVSYIRERFEEMLSDKLILDKKQVEEMVEKRREERDKLGEEPAYTDWTVYENAKQFVLDLNSLLTNQANDVD